LSSSSVQILKQGDMGRVFLDTGLDTGLDMVSLLISFTLCRISRHTAIEL
jgi:hypothetical protein